MLACRDSGLFLFAYGEAATVNNRGAIMNLSAGRRVGIFLCMQVFSDKPGLESDKPGLESDKPGLESPMKAAIASPFGGTICVFPGGKSP